MNNNADIPSKKTAIHVEPYSLVRDIIANIWVVILSALIGVMAVYIWSRGMYVRSTQAPRAHRKHEKLRGVHIHEPLVLIRNRGDLHGGSRSADS